MRCSAVVQQPSDPSWRNSASKFPARRRLTKYSCAAASAVGACGAGAVISSGPTRFVRGTVGIGGVTISEEQFEVYEEAQGQSRWRKVAANGEIVEESERSYTQPEGARAAAKRNDAMLPAALVRERPEGEGDYHAHLPKDEA